MRAVYLGLDDLKNFLGLLDGRGDVSVRFRTGEGGRMEGSVTGVSVSIVDEMWDVVIEAERDVTL